MADKTEQKDPRLIGAELAKLAAETAKLDAERQAIELDHAIKRAEADRVTAEARKAAAYAEDQELDTAKARRLHAAVLAGDEHHHVYTFGDAVSGATVKACMTKLTEWSRLDPGCDIELRFNSPGGSVIDGMALWDFLNQLRGAGHRLTTVAYGYAASMAGILLQAGDVRVIGRESYLMIHEVSFGASGKVGDVEDTVAWVNKIQGRVLDIFANRSKLTRLRVERRWRRKDWWLDSTEALKLGFVDEIR